MNSIKEYIESGILELYVLGNITLLESTTVEVMASNHPEIAHEIDLIASSLNCYAYIAAKEPDPIIKPFLMATIDYSERLKNGEEMSFPPSLTPQSKISDFTEWLSRDDMVLHQKLTDLSAKIIGFTPEMITAIVWIKEMAPQEVHANQIEKFLIIEGTCDIVIEEEIHHLKAGDMLSIPLYKNHFVKVTSSIPCKVILQRAAA